MVSLLLEVLVGGCQGGMPQDEVPNLMKLICTLQHTLQVVLIPVSRDITPCLHGLGRTAPKLALAAVLC